MGYFSGDAGPGSVDIHDAIQAPLGGTGEDFTSYGPAGTGAVYLLLADGCSTGGSGAQAAQYAIADAHKHLGGCCWSPAALPDALLAADRTNRVSATGGSSTLIAAIVAEGSVWLASTGDSQAWMFTGRDRVQLTLRQDRTRIGSRIPEPELKGPIPLNGHLVFGSDGLWRCLWPEHVEAIVNAQPHRPAQALIDRILEQRRELVDDTSALVVTPRWRTAPAL